MCTYFFLQRIAEQYSVLHQSAKHVLNDLLNLSVEDKVQVLENIENTIGAANMVRVISGLVDKPVFQICYVV